MPFSRVWTTVHSAYSKVRTQDVLGQVSRRILDMKRLETGCYRGWLRPDTDEIVYL